MQHGVAINPQTENVFVSLCTTAIGDDVLEHRQRWRDVIVGDGTGGHITQCQADSIAIQLDATNTDPIAGGVAGNSTSL